MSRQRQSNTRRTARSSSTGSGVVSAASTLRCPHGGRVVPATGEHSRAVRVDGVPVATGADAFTVVGCPHTVAGRAQPCATVRWTTGGQHHGPRVDGSPLLLGSGEAWCLSAGLIPQGAPVVVPSTARGVTCR